MNRMELLTVLVFMLGLVTAYAGFNCADVSGNWENELGSRMLLKIDESDRISGEYYTSVETNPGAAAFVSNVTGLFSSHSDGSILAFSVIFNYGSSLATWVGQCMVCDGKEVLHTTYTLRKYVADHREKWAAIITNHNTFWRIEDKYEREADNPETNFSPDRLSVLSDKHSGVLDLRGKWKSKDNEEIEIFGMNGHILEGRTTCCHQAGKHHSTDLIGQTDGSEIFTALTFMSASGKRIRSWTGHIYDAASSVSKILETSWLEHEFNPSCTSARNGVRFGAQNFTRTNAGFENIVNKQETFLDKLRKFFSSMF